MYNLNRINNELDKIVQMHQEAKMQKTIMQSKEKLKQAELSSIGTKYGFMLFHSLKEECHDLYHEFMSSLVEIKKNTSEKIKVEPIKMPLHEEIYNSKNAQVNYISQIQKIIENSPTLAIADNHYSSLKDKQREYKYEFTKNTGEFKKTYIDEINRAQSNLIAAERQSNQLSLQQQLENALKQSDEMRAMITQKDQVINQINQEKESLQQRHENDLRRIGELREETRQAVEHAAQKEQENQILRQDFLEEVGGIEHFVESARLQLSDFIDSHPDLEDIDILIQIKETLGEDSQPQVDIV